MKFFKIVLLTLISLLFLSSSVSANQSRPYKSAIYECKSGKYKAKFKLFGKANGKKVTVKKIHFRFLPETTERNNNKVTVKINKGRGLRPQTVIGCGGKCNSVIMVPYTKWEEVTKKDRLLRNGKWEPVKVNFTIKKGQEIYLQATFDKPLWDANCDVKLKA